MGEAGRLHPFVSLCRRSGPDVLEFPTSGSTLVPNRSYQGFRIIISMSRTVWCVCRVCVMHAFYAFCTFHALIESVSYGFIEGCAPEKRPAPRKILSAYPHARIRVFHHSGPEIPGSAREGKPRSFFLCFRLLLKKCRRLGLGLSFSASRLGRLGRRWR